MSDDLNINAFKNYMLSEDEYILIGLCIIPLLVCVSVCVVFIRRMNNLEIEEPLIEV